QEEDRAEVEKFHRVRQTLSAGGRLASPAALLHIERIPPSFKSKRRHPIWNRWRRCRPHSRPGNTTLPLLPLILLALPLVEIAGFALVGSLVGVLPTVAL